MWPDGSYSCFSGFGICRAGRSRPPIKVILSVINEIRQLSKLSLKIYIYFDNFITYVWKILLRCPCYQSLYKVQYPGDICPLCEPFGRGWLLSENISSKYSITSWYLKIRIFQTKIIISSTVSSHYVSGASISQKHNSLQHHSVRILSTHLFNEEYMLYSNNKLNMHIKNTIKFNLSWNQ